MGYCMWCNNDKDITFVIGWHYSDVTWASWCLGSPATQVFVQQFVRANIKETPKLRNTGHLWKEPTGRPPVDSPHKGPVTQNVFPCHGLIMSYRCWVCIIRTSRPRQNGRRFGDIFEMIFLYENYRILFQFHWFFSSMVKLLISQPWFR